jgi:hypothetical protein
VEAAGGGEFLLQEFGDPLDEIDRTEISPKDGDPSLLRFPEEKFGDFQPPSDDQTGQGQTTDLMNHLLLHLGSERFKISRFRIADNLKPFGVDELDKPRHGQPHLLDLRMGDLFLEPLSPSH